MEDIDELDPNSLLKEIDKARKITDENPPDYLLLAESEMRGSNKVEIDKLQDLVNLLTDPSVKLLNYGKSFTIKEELKPKLYTLPRQLSTTVSEYEDGGGYELR